MRQYSQLLDMAGDLRPTRARTAAAVSRAAFAAFVAESRVLGTNYPGEVAAKLYGEGDRAVAIINRADSTPATTSTATALADLPAGAAFLESLAPLSAAARPMAGGIAVPLRGVNALNFPRRASGPVAMTWVDEDDPIPVATRAFGSTAFGPAAKLALIVTCSRELARRAGAEVIFSTILREDAAVGLDAAMFSTADGEDARPDGLLFGVTETPAYPGDDAVALEMTLKALLGAIAANGSTQPVIIAAPTQAASISVTIPTLSVPVWPSLALSTGTVIAIDAAALLHNVEGVDIDTAIAATLHMADEDPLPIISGAPVTADPVREMFQTDTIALRLILDAAFAIRAPGLVAFTTEAAW